MNQLLALAEGDGTGATPTNAAIVHDLAGNLVADPGSFYQYDGFNRLVAVHRRGSLVFDGEGEVASGTAGAQVAFFTYDALGRLIRKLSPFPGVGSTYRAEHYYYDGIRRVQEVFTDPIPNYSPFGVAEEEDTSPTTWLDREYVHAPGGGGGAGGPAAPGYVDSYICQIDAFGRVAFVVQDAGHAPVALVAGDGSSGGTHTPGTLIERYTFDPYGVLLEVTPGTALWGSGGAAMTGSSRIGHQGLFLDRLDADCLQPTMAAGRPGAAPNSSGTAGGNGTLAGGLAGGPSIGIYHNRNRTYAAHLGRFMQRDPNGTSSPVLSDAAWFGGRAAERESLAVDCSEHYADGLSAYGAFLCNPVARGDAMGLWGGYLGSGLGGGHAGGVNDPFDMLDDIVAEHAGSQAAWMQAVQGGFNSVAFVAATLAQMNPVIAAAVAGHRLVNGNFAIWDLANLVPFGRMGSVISRSAGAYASAASRYGSGAVSIAGRAAPRYFMEHQAGTAARNCVVYFGFDSRTGRMRYVGMTTDFPSRAAYWKSKRGYDCKAQIGNLTEYQARAVESFVKHARGPDLDNVIMSIARGHPFFQDAMGMAWDLIERHGTRIYR